jgi:hypothetical protein
VRRLGGLEALGRGIANVRGNLELVGVSAGGALLVLAVVLLALVPFLGLGEEELVSLFGLSTGRASPEDYATLAARSWQALSNLWELVLALGVGLTLGSIVFSWYFGGVLGVLVAGDAQAPPGAGRSRELFRTWSWRLFAGEATRLVWRVLLFYSLWLLFALLAMLLFGVLVALAVALGGRAGAGAGWAIGCGGALPLVFLFFALVGAMSLGQVELVPPASGVGAATRAGVALLGRRLGAAVALFVLYFATTLVVGVVEAGAGLALSGALSGRPLAHGVAQGAMFLVQLMVSAFLNLVLVAAFVALARSERRLVADAAA